MSNLAKFEGSLTCPVDYEMKSVNVKVTNSKTVKEDVSNYHNSIDTNTDTSCENLGHSSICKLNNQECVLNNNILTLIGTVQLQLNNPEIFGIKNS